jgi:acyl CoA:acetate/3-ketoacid CoA transferase beta subunit
MSFFGHDESFAMIRGGHIDISVLGALEVSEKGDLANWAIGNMADYKGDVVAWIKTGRFPPGIGGAMDLAVGAKKVIVSMIHTTKDNKPKIVRECKYELTAKQCVSLIFTDLAVIEITPKGLVLKEIAPGFTPNEIQAVTEPHLIIAKDLKEIEL